jgi:hypothetical protein
MGIVEKPKAKNKLTELKEGVIFTEENQQKLKDFSLTSYLGE